MLSLSPEQMRWRWLALGVVATAFILSFFQRFAPAGIAQDLAASFGTTAASLGLLAATYFYVYTVMQIPTGILADTLGPRRIVALGGIVGGIGSLLFGFAPSFELALVGRADAAGAAGQHLAALGREGLQRLQVLVVDEGGLLHAELAELRAAAAKLLLLLAVL